MILSVLRLCVVQVDGPFLWVPFLFLVGPYCDLEVELLDMTFFVICPTKGGLNKLEVLGGGLVSAAVSFPVCLKETCGESLT